MQNLQLVSSFAQRLLVFACDGAIAHYLHKMFTRVAAASSVLPLPWHAKLRRGLQGASARPTEVSTQLSRCSCQLQTKPQRDRLSRALMLCEAARLCTKHKVTSGLDRS